MERKQKEEEDEMFRKFEAERRQAESETDKETEQEWESRLKDIIKMHEHHKIDDDEFHKVSTHIYISYKLPVTY